MTVQHQRARPNASRHPAPAGASAWCHALPIWAVVDEMALISPPDNVAAVDPLTTNCARLVGAKPRLDGAPVWEVAGRRKRPIRALRGNFFVRFSTCCEAASAGFSGFAARARLGCGIVAASGVLWRSGPIRARGRQIGVVPRRRAWIIRDLFCVVITANVGFIHPIAALRLHTNYKIGRRPLVPSY